MRRVFLTGGAGYIGSIMAERLLAAGYEVTVYDSLVTGHREAVPEAADFIHGDLADAERLYAALRARPYDVVFHFAAFIQAGESMREPGKYFRNNVANTIHLLEAMVAAGVNALVFSSTAAVYRWKDTPLREEDPIEPTNVYGQTKYMVEQMLQWYQRVHGLRYAALRYFNAAGASAIRGEDHPDESHLIPLVLQVALGQRPHIAIFGTDYPTPDGTAIRDYIHVLDLVEAHLLAMDALEDRARLVYNLGNGRGYSVKEVIETARRVTGHPIPAVEAPRRPGDPPRLVASSERAQRELGWRPRFPALEDIIASAWAWHRAHPYGYAGMPHKA
ncbi:MAG: UDP-glucose 4-epimerase GalE [Chloroflexi bacterium]|nr:UDP-glucose 4-epimerase GalE [Chloroflexota bacterium]